MCSTGSSCGQQVPNVIRCHGNWLIVSRIAWNQTFTAFQCKFHIFAYFSNFIGFHCWLVMTCVMPSQCHIISLVLMPVIQLICCSSVEAYLPWKCCFHCLLKVFHKFAYCFICFMKSTVSLLNYCYVMILTWDILLVQSIVAGKLCNKCLSGKSTKISSSIHYFIWSLALYWTAEPQEALWHFGGQCGARGLKLLKLP